MIVKETIVTYRPPAAPVGGDIGAELAYENYRHFGAVQGTPGIGLGHCSCNASIAILTRGDYPLAISGHFSVMHGNSQIFRGLDPDNPVPAKPCSMFASSSLGQHAEQIVVQLMVTKAPNGVQPWLQDNMVHVYIDLSPCPGCRRWLTDYNLNFALYYVEDYANADNGTLARIHRANRRHFK